MSVLNFVQFYKDVLNEKEHGVLSKFAPVAYEGNSSACALFCSRFSREQSERILTGIIRADAILDLLDLFYFVGATESVYVRYKNEKLLLDCYSFCTQRLNVLENQNDSLSLTLCSFCFDKLRFFASVLNATEDKLNFSKLNAITLDKINALPFSLAPLFTLSYPLEIVEEKIRETAPSFTLSPLSLTCALLCVRGLISYGYYDLADKIKDEIYENTQPVLNLDNFSSAILCELSLTD